MTTLDHPTRATALTPAHDELVAAQLAQTTSSTAAQGWRPERHTARTSTAAPTPSIASAAAAWCRDGLRVVGGVLVLAAGVFVPVYVLVLVVRAVVLWLAMVAS
jgi:hypothetical protein